MKQSHVLFVVILFLNITNSMFASMRPGRNIKLPPIQAPIEMGPANKLTSKQIVDVINAIIERDCDFVQEFIKHNPNRINEVKDPVKGNTALMYAAAAKHPEMVNMLLRAGADMAQENKQHGTVLEQMVYETNSNRADPKAALEILKLLIRHGIDLTGMAGSNALMIAIQGNNIEAIKLLLHHGADMHIINHYPSRPYRLAVNAPLDLALAQPNEKIKQIFLAHDALRIIDVHTFPTTPPQNINAKTQDHYAKYLRRRLQNAFLLFKQGNPKRLHDMFFDEIFPSQTALPVVTKFFTFPEDFNVLIDYLAQTDYEKQIAQSMHISEDEEDDEE